MARSSKSGSRGMTWVCCANSGWSSRWKAHEVARQRSGVQAHLPLTEDIADAPHRLDQTGLAACFRLRPQVADIHVQHTVCAAEIVPPDLLQDARTRQHLLGV